MLLQLTLKVDHYRVTVHRAVGFGISCMGVELLNHLQKSSDFT